MKDKYYTPTIEEFHVGFEYEFKTNGLGFVKTEVSETGGFFQGEKRVKYLDREDIESLGWVRDMERGMTKDSKVYYKDNYMLLHDNNGISICVADPAKDKKMMYYLRSNEVYMLNIKNKSELKKLLKQLNINDND
tara:strand:- start:440 stop:844 length:405 start_codon:yes stop_codon:yes gene_type:complete